MSLVRRYIADDGKSKIVEISWPSNNDLRQILSGGQIEFVSVRMKLKTPELEFVARIIENRTERNISYIEYEGYRERYKDYDFVYDEISHCIYANSTFSRTINELSPLASLIRYFTENHLPSCSAEIAEKIYNSGIKKKASLVRQQIQNLRKIHPKIIINVDPYKRYALNTELKSLFILSDLMVA